MENCDLIPTIVDFFTSIFFPGKISYEFEPFIQLVSSFTGSTDAIDADPVYNDSKSD